MNVLELYSGSAAISSVFAERGHNTCTIDIDERCCPDICMDLLDVTPSIVIDYFNGDGPDYIHMSPDCSTYSIAGCWRHRDGIRPISDRAVAADNTLIQSIILMLSLDPYFFTIENPRGMMRKLPVMEEFRRDTVTYCQYGDSRMKPTDIWHNLEHEFRKPCKNGDSCHVPSPRGSYSGTQRTRDPRKRSLMPYELCVEICDAVERNMELI